MPTATSERAVIILVEEEADIRTWMTGLLEQGGFVVAAVDTTDDALKLLEQHRGSVGIVTDAHVPGTIDGWELAHEVRRRRPDVALVLISAHSDASSGPLPEGAEFLIKPYVVSNLVPTLRRMLNKEDGTST